MPLGRAHVGHRLDDLVFRSERRGERFGEVAHAAVARAQRLAVVVAAVAGTGEDGRCAVMRRAIRNRPRPTRRYGWERTTPRRRSSCSPLSRLKTFGAHAAPDCPFETSRLPGARFGRLSGPAVDPTRSRNPASVTGIPGEMPATRAFHASGCSKYGEWPAPSISSTRAPGTRAAASAIDAGREDLVVGADDEQRRDARARRAARRRTSRRPACAAAASDRRADRDGARRSAGRGARAPGCGRRSRSRARDD